MIFFNFARAARAKTEVALRYEAQGGEGLVTANHDMGSMTTEQAQECADFVESEIKRIVEAFEAGQK